MRAICTRSATLVIAASLLAWSAAADNAPGPNRPKAEPNSTVSDNSTTSRTKETKKKRPKFKSISNVMKTKHDTAEASINNVR